MQFEQVQWTEFKEFVDSRSLSIQFRETSDMYFLKAADQWFGLSCFLSKTTDTTDITVFETSYKAASNLSIKTEVTTQFEKDDKTLKLIRAQANVDGNGEALIEIKCPGTFAGVTSDKLGRFIDWGKAWFSLQHAEDSITEVCVVDKDNKLGGGAGLVVRTYHDDDAPTANQGWVIPKHEGTIQVDALGGYGFIPAELYLRIKGKKGESQTSGVFYINIKWGKAE